MKKNLYSQRLHLFILLTGLLLLELSYNTIIFAAKAPKANLLIENEIQTTRIIHGTCALTNSDGEDVIKNASGTVFN